jgi:hypothetical protein
MGNALGRVLINEQIKVRFWGTADADGNGALTVSVANDPGCVKTWPML